MSRRKMFEDEKRNKFIGIKVKDDTKKKLQFIANRESVQLSTYIDILLVTHINEYFSHAHINWEALNEVDDQEEGSFSVSV